MIGLDKLINRFSSDDVKGWELPRASYTEATSVEVIGCYAHTLLTLCRIKHNFAQYRFSQLPAYASSL